MENSKRKRSMVHVVVVLVALCTYRGGDASTMECVCSRLEHVGQCSNASMQWHQSRAMGSSQQIKACEADSNTRADIRLSRCGLRGSTRCNGTRWLSRRVQKGHARGTRLGSVSAYHDEDQSVKAP